jgi:hypothetical protein
MCEETVTRGQGNAMTRGQRGRDMEGPAFAAMRKCEQNGGHKIFCQHLRHRTQPPGALGDSLAGPPDRRSSSSPRLILSRSPCLQWFLAFLSSLLLLLGCGFPASAQDAMKDIEFFSSLKNRAAGSQGAEDAADYILKVFSDIGLSEIGAQEFLLPTPEAASASLEVDGENLDLYPWGPNLVYLSVTPGEGIKGPLLYAGDGDIKHFEGRNVKGSIVLMEMSSWENWTSAAMLGASALIFLGDPNTTKGEFEQKNIPTPVAFPRYWANPETGGKLKDLALKRAAEATIASKSRWRNTMLRNCYGFLQGKNPQLKAELIVLEAFYDASSSILGLAPGADESTSIAMLLTVARRLAGAPPERSVLFLATAGNGQSFAGMRQFIWSVTARKKLLRKESKQLQEQRQRVGRQLELLQTDDPLAVKDPKEQEMVLQILLERAKDKADALIRETQYQQAYMSEGRPPGLEDPKPYRHLSWITDLQEMTPEQQILAMDLLKTARSSLKARQKELKLRHQAVKTSETIRNLLDEYTPVLYLSLHLSSHSPYLGLTEMGETYPLRENVKRMVRASRLNTMLGQVAAKIAGEEVVPNMLDEATRGSSAEGGFSKIPAGCSLSSDTGLLAGLPAVSLMTLDDDRSLWSTPHDTFDRMDKTTISTLTTFLPPLLSRLFSHPSLQLGIEAGMAGLASLEGQAMFIRQGELFPDQPAPGTIISVIQGNSIFRTMVFQDGTFFMPGMANKRVSLEKLILEPYGLDPDTGRVAWTADKVQTRKVNYRIKVKTDLASTSLVMFHCLQTDVFNVFNPQNFGYLTKVSLLDAATEAPPLRLWYSRVDGRDNMTISIFLEKNTRFKLIMAESLLRKELLLLNNSPDSTIGKGFLIGDPATILVAPYQAAKDLRNLDGERLGNLFQHGIMNWYLEALYKSSVQAVNESQNDLIKNQYGQFWDRVIAAWATLDTIYTEIESTQRDVLTGVMFFIALFVPFAYCMERYLFCFRNIYQQIVAFLLILLMTIFTIRALHPAFKLTYSPMVVIIAFFIVGLSLLVSWIIFMRFEEEMAHEQRRAQHGTPQASKMKAFGAGFAIGVSNLNRRKLRTGLTCVTLIILTFTVMSFTNVKSLHRTTDTRIADTAAYKGVLLRHQYRLPLTPVTLDYMKARFGSEAAIWPRAWIDPRSSAERTVARAYVGRKYASVEGILGLGRQAPDQFLQIVKHGRWFQEGEKEAILISLAMARQLGLDPERDQDSHLQLLGTQFKVVGYFDEDLLQSFKDLDQNPFTPAYLEMSQSEELSEVEIEAMQSGEDVLPKSERFRYASAEATVILPFKKCIDYGCSLKAISILPGEGQSPFTVAEDLSSWLAFPLFVGEQGVWYHNASTTVRYQGVANLLVPILIVIFITLNTMIGHVHERQREIGTYTSVGLAPIHVGFLFIVEALSLAAISTVIGYILAQLSAKFLGHTALFSQLTFNYSSMASVACMFLVFSVVFLAALYPARMAAEIAMPDVNRSWSLPDAEGDVLSMNLPFLLKYEEEEGVMRFLYTFFKSHQDAAQGTFIVDEVDFNMQVPEAKPGQMPAPLCPLIRMNTWLAPFDFGIKQHLQLHCCHSLDDPGYLEVGLLMTRLSGERSAWSRANKNFIKALRKQMLLWRLLDPKAKDVFFSEQWAVVSGSI